jgi:hypothetical protein
VQCKQKKWRGGHGGCRREQKGRRLGLMGPTVFYTYTSFIDPITQNSGVVLD